MYRFVVVIDMIVVGISVLMLIVVNVMLMNYDGKYLRNSVGIVKFGLNVLKYGVYCGMFFMLEVSVI